MSESNSPSPLARALRLAGLSLVLTIAGFILLYDVVMYYPYRLQLFGSEHGQIKNLLPDLADLPAGYLFAFEHDL